jgi:MscS family membrane protein
MGEPVIEEELLVEAPIVEETIVEEQIGNPNSSGTIISLLFKWVLALVVLMAAVFLRGLISKTVSSVIGGVVGKVGRKGEEQKKKVAEALTGPISFTCVMAGVFAAGRFVDMPDDLEAIFNNIIKSLLDVLVFWIVFDLIDPISQIIQKTGTGQVGEEVRKVLVDLTKGLVVVLGFLAILQFWGINVAAFLAGFGLVGMAVALAAQDTMKNFFASVAMFADKSFQKGEWILTPAVEGIVEDVGLRSTLVRQFDTSLVIVPNATLANATITNFDRCTARRITWTLPIAGSATAQQLKNIVANVGNYINSHPRVDKEKAIIYSLDAFGENCIKFFVYFFLKTLDWKQFMIEKQEILLFFQRIVENEGTSFGVPTRYVLLQDQR